MNFVSLLQSYNFRTNFLRLQQHNPDQGIVLVNSPIHAVNDDGPNFIFPPEADRQEIPEMGIILAGIQRFNKRRIRATTDRVDIKDVIFECNNSKYYWTNYDELDTPEYEPIFIKIPISNFKSAVEEINLIVFLDYEKSIVDWKTTLDNFVNFSNKIGYYQEHAKLFLCKLVAKFNPAEYVSLRTKSAGEILSRLKQLGRNQDRRLIRKEQIATTVRKKGELLSNVLAAIETLAHALYPADNQDDKKNRSLIQFNALCSFTKEDLSYQISRYVQVSLEENSELNYELSKNVILDCELYSENRPAKDLFYKNFVHVFDIPNTSQVNSVLLDHSNIFTKKRHEKSATNDCLNYLDAHFFLTEKRHNRYFEFEQALNELSRQDIMKSVKFYERYLPSELPGATPAPAFPIPAPALPIPAPALPIPAPALPIPAPALPNPAIPMAQIPAHAPAHAPAQAHAPPYIPNQVLNPAPVQILDQPHARRTEGQLEQDHGQVFQNQPPGHGSLGDQSSTQSRQFNDHSLQHPYDEREISDNEDDEYYETEGRGNNSPLSPEKVKKPNKRTEHPDNYSNDRIDGTAAAALGSSLSAATVTNKNPIVVTEQSVSYVKPRDSLDPQSIALSKPKRTVKKPDRYDNNSMTQLEIVDLKKSMIELRQDFGEMMALYMRDNKSGRDNYFKRNYNGNDYIRPSSNTRYADRNNSRYRTNSRDNQSQSVYRSNSGHRFERNRSESRGKDYRYRNSDRKDSYRNNSRGRSNDKKYDTSRYRNDRQGSARDYNRNNRQGSAGDYNRYNDNRYQSYRSGSSNRYYNNRDTSNRSDSRNRYNNDKRNNYQYGNNRGKSGENEHNRSRDRNRSGSYRYYSDRNRSGSFDRNKKFSESYSKNDYRSKSAGDKNKTFQRHTSPKSNSNYRSSSGSRNRMNDSKNKESSIRCLKCNSPSHFTNQCLDKNQ